MSFDDVFRPVLGLLALWLAATGAHTLWTGRLRLARGSYRRAERAADYWRELLLLFMSAAIVLAWLLFVPVPADRPPSYIPMFVFAVVGPLVARAIWAGRIEYDRVCIWRQDQPRRYWTWLVIGIAALGFGLFVFVRDMLA